MSWMSVSIINLDVLNYGCSDHEIILLFTSFIVSSLKNEILTHNFVFPFSIFVLIRILIYPNLCSLVWKLISKLHCSIFQNHKWIYIIMCNIYLNIQHIYLYMPNILLSFLFSQLTNEKNKVICENFKMNDANLHVTVLYISESRPTLWNTLQLEILF